MYTASYRRNYKQGVDGGLLTNPWWPGGVDRSLDGGGVPWRLTNLRIKASLEFFAPIFTHCIIVACFNLILHLSLPIWRTKIIKMYKFLLISHVQGHT